MEKYSVDDLETIASSYCDDLEHCKGCKMLYETIKFMRENPEKIKAICRRNGSNGFV